MLLGERAVCKIIEPECGVSPGSLITHICLPHLAEETTDNCWPLAWRLSTSYNLVSCCIKPFKSLSPIPALGERRIQTYSTIRAGRPGPFLRDPRCSRSRLGTELLLRPRTHGCVVDSDVSALPFRVPVGRLAPNAIHGIPTGLSGVPEADTGRPARLPVRNNTYHVGTGFFFLSARACCVCRAAANGEHSKMVVPPSGAMDRGRTPTSQDGTRNGIIYPRSRHGSGGRRCSRRLFATRNLHICSRGLATKLVTGSLRVPANAGPSTAQPCRRSLGAASGSGTPSPISPARSSPPYNDDGGAEGDGVWFHS